MAQLHVGVQTGSNTWEVVIHGDAPPGNNSAGEPWQAALLASGASGTTSMAEGVGTGKITTAEKSAVEAGTTLELTTVLVVQEPQADADWLAARSRAWNKYTAKLQRGHVWYGRTEG